MRMDDCHYDQYQVSKQVSIFTPIEAINKNISAYLGIKSLEFYFCCNPFLLQNGDNSNSLLYAGIKCVRLDE